MTSPTLQKTMPAELLQISSHPSVIGEIMHQAKSINHSEYPWASRFVGGFPIPDWQRELCWDQEQEIKLIESIWLGLDIGCYTVND